jgi:SAM-dependent methyltransferase
LPKRYEGNKERMGLDRSGFIEGALKPNARELQGGVVMVQLYDQLGIGYARLRRPDPRLAARICQALGAAATVVNVGAGAGSYEPLDRHVIAVEPSLTMIHQRPRGSAPVVCASATHLPFKDGAFAAALAVLTVHHWPDRARGLRELARVARDRVVVVTWDPAYSGFWLIDDYFPAIGALDRRLFPTMEEFQRALGGITIRPLPIPHDCTDGFLGAYWRRPHAYLKQEVRNAISAFVKIAGVEEGLTRLAQELADGTWERRHGHLLHQKELDLGYRLVISGEAMWRSPRSMDCQRSVTP